MPNDTIPIVGMISGQAPDSNLADKLLIDIAELAKLTSLSIRTLRRMDASRDIPGRVVVRRCVRFKTQIIGQWVQLGLPNNDQWAELQKRNLGGGK